MYLEQNSVERLTRPSPVSFFDRRYFNTFYMTCYIGSKLISCLLACFCIGASKNLFGRFDHVYQ